MKPMTSRTTQRPEPAWPPPALLKSAREAVRQTCDRLDLKLDPQTKRALVLSECLIKDGCKHARLGGLDAEAIHFVRARIYDGQKGRIDESGLPTLTDAAVRGTDRRHG